MASRFSPNLGNGPTTSAISAETEGPIVERALGDLLGGEMGHGHRDLEHDGPKTDGVLVALDVELAGGVVVQPDQVDRRQVAGGVVEKHVLRARVGCVDPPTLRAGV